MSRESSTRLITNQRVIDADMQALVYLHGFLSSPQSLKAQQTGYWLTHHYPEVEFFCPPLSSYPDEAKQQLENLINLLHEKFGEDISKQVGLIGSSLGGFWATWLVERFNLRAAVVNPATQPQELMKRFLNQTLKSYHSEQTYSLQPRHVEEIISADLPVTRFQNYWLLAQTGDEVLDYRLAEKKYMNCKQTIEQGGDHGFQGYEQKLPDIFKFLAG